jgi:signal transduction histidine kinase
VGPTKKKAKEIQRAADATNNADRQLRKAEDRFHTAIQKFRKLTRGLTPAEVRVFTRRWVR